MNIRRIWLAALTLSLIAGFFFSSIATGQTKPPAKSPANIPAVARIDVNKATAEQLSTCPGITPALAKAIVEYRTKSGPFKTPEDLLKVKGITKDILNRIKPKVEKDTVYVMPVDPEEEEEPSLKPSKC
jgi:competence protein ComEA